MSRDLPAGWTRTSIGDVAQIRTGGTPSRSNEEYWGGAIPWMSSGEIHQRFVVSTSETITAAGINNSNARLLPARSVMVALNGQGKTRGKTAILKTAMTCNQSLAAIIPEVPNVPEFFRVRLSRLTPGRRDCEPKRRHGMPRRAAVHCGPAPTGWAPEAHALLEIRCVGRVQRAAVSEALGDARRCDRGPRAYRSSACGRARRRWYWSP